MQRVGLPSEKHPAIAKRGEEIIKLRKRTDYLFHRSNLEIQATGLPCLSQECRASRPRLDLDE
jgi:hypothetical protein